MACMQRNGDPASASVVIMVGHISAAPGSSRRRAYSMARRACWSSCSAWSAAVALYPPALPTHAPLTAELLLEIDEVVRSHDSASN
jgi:hypothetical protein